LPGSFDPSEKMTDWQPAAVAPDVDLAAGATHQWQRISRCCSRYRGSRTSINRAGWILERAKGIEPSYAAWEAAVLPLNYARVMSECIQYFKKR
jgi:hypothetical protein